MKKTHLSSEALSRALALRDLTDPAQGPHAMQLLLAEVVDALRARWGCAVEVRRAHPVVHVTDNYDALGYPADGAARDSRYTRYVTDDTLLRTQTSAMVPAALRELARQPARDTLLVCPGLVYRRDSVDRLHAAEPHQVDLWRLCPRDDDGPHALATTVLAAALPGCEWRATPTEHPYTREGLQLDVRDGDEWIEVGECGVASPALVARSGLSDVRGLAMGLGLDRLLMLRKGMPDIRLLRSTDVRVIAQLGDLSPWRALSRQPPVTRDLSLAVSPERAQAELLGDEVREALGTDAALVESVSLMSVTPALELSPAARGRIGLGEGQVNVLLRVVLRAVDRALTTAECNVLRDRLWRALHEGAVDVLTSAVSGRASR
ncbi:MAG: hypothetical protein ACOZQL_39565 [Myxococcota bacterium]